MTFSFKRSKRFLKPGMLKIRKSEYAQWGLYLIFLIFFYFQESKTIDYISRGGIAQQRTIQDFLNHLSFAFLPERFYILFPYLAVLLISILFSDKYRWFFLALMSFLLSALLVIDKTYSMFFMSVISSSSLKVVSHAWGAKNLIVQVVNPYDCLYLLIGLFFLIAGLLFYKHSNGNPSNGQKRSAASLIPALFFLIGALYCYQVAFFLPGKNVVVDRDNNLRVYRYDSTKGGSDLPTLPDYKLSNRDFAATFGIMNYHVQDLLGSIKGEKQKVKIDKSGSTELMSFFQQRKQLNAQKSPFYGISKGRNVILIHFESLNPILINLSIGGEPVTPTLNKIIEGGLYWEYILDQTRFGGSSDSEFSVLTGMLPDVMDMVTFNSDIMKSLPALPRYLQKMNYNTISLHGFDKYFWSRDINHPLLGFKTMFFRNDFNSNQQLGWGVPDREFFIQSADKLIKYPFPFFAFLITLSTHSPYLVPPGYSDYFKDTLDPKNQLIRYLQLIRYTDEALGIFLEKMRNVDEVWSNSLIIIYGDHKPGLDAESESELEKISGKSLLDPRYQCVPAIILIPGQESYIQKHKTAYQTTVGGLYDLFPTIVHLMGLEVPEGVFGTHLFVPNKNRGSVPVVKYGQGFVFNGILYKGADMLPYEDKNGLVFTNHKSDILENQAERLKVYHLSQQMLTFNKYIFHSDFDFKEFESQFAGSKSSKSIR